MSFCIWDILCCYCQIYWNFCYSYSLLELDEGFLAGFCDDTEDQLIYSRSEGLSYADKSMSENFFKKSLVISTAEVKQELLSVWFILYSCIFIFLYKFSLIFLSSMVFKFIIQTNFYKVHSLFTFQINLVFTLKVLFQKIGQQVWFKIFSKKFISFQIDFMRIVMN